MGVDEVLAQQAALYGEPLSARFARVLQAYRIPQSRLAAVIGLSAPMLSQLASGQRVKISNPAVFARLLRLEELAASDEVRSGDPTLVEDALTAVAASRPQLTTEHAVGGTVEAHLARIATDAELRAAADAIPAGALQTLLRSAAAQAAIPEASGPR